MRANAAELAAALSAQESRRLGRPLTYDAYNVIRSPGLAARAQEALAAQEAERLAQEAFAPPRRLNSLWFEEFAREVFALT